MRIPFARISPKNPKSRLAAAAVATVLSLTPLAACGGSSGSSSDSKTLDMWTFKQSHVAGLRNAAAAFKKQTGITVNIQAFTPDDAYSTKVSGFRASRGTLQLDWYGHGYRTIWFNS